MYSHDDAKARAKKVRTILNNLGHDISHATALEVIARQADFKDWNTYAAALEKSLILLPIPEGWESGGDLPDQYDIGIYQAITYKGIHPAVIRYKQSSPKEAKGYANFFQAFDPVDYRGKRIKFSSTLKCDACDGAVTLWLRADSDTRRAISFDNLEDKGISASNGPISGTTDWTQRTIVLDIPTEATSISMGFYLRGKGTGYAAGFTMDRVSKEIPLSAPATNGHTQPLNMTLKSTISKHTKKL